MHAGRIVSVIPVIYCKLEHRSFTIITADFLGFTPPRHPPGLILDRLKSEYALEGRLYPLEGERDQNHRLLGTDGAVHVVKISSENEDPAVVDFQTAALLHIQAQDPSLAVPRICKTLDGRYYASIGKAANRLRLLTYLDGIPLSAGNVDSLALASNAGIFLGRMSRALATFSHTAENHFLAWNMSCGLVDDDAIWASAAADIQALEAELRPLVRRQILPRLAQQRSQVVHNDAHQDNLLRKGLNSEEVVGIIDFGDMIKTAPICDLAILCLGFVERSRSPQQSVANAVAGYHLEYPLLKREPDLVYDLMLARETLTLLLFDFKIARDASASDYVRESRPGLMQSLIRLREIGAGAFRDAIFDVCKF